MLIGELTARQDITSEAVESLQKYFAQWCQTHNVYGSLTHQAIEPSVDMTDTCDPPFPISTNFEFIEYTYNSFSNGEDFYSDPI